MSYIQCPLHPHVLSLRNFSQHFQTSLQKKRSITEDSCFQCDVCKDEIDCSTSMYCCDKCELNIHTSCVTVPRQIQHPRHKHPLDLQVRPRRYVEFSYRCVIDSSCNFKLKGVVAMRTLWVEKYYCSMLQEAGDGESRLQFAHEHPLTSFPVRTRIFCGGCGMQISEEAYGCSECNFFLHESCAKAPPKIQSHPFHPNHPLHLFYDPLDEFKCHACRSRCPIRYRCEECELIFDLSCVISTMPCEDDDEREDTRRRPSVIDHSLHPHQLSSYHSKTQTMIECRICEHRIPSGDFFGCLHCQFFLHESCAQPPMEIKHYLHPEHALTFAQCPSEKEHKCPICESPVNSDSHCYTCQMCDFFIHQTCASATLSDLEKGVGMTVQCSFHEHDELKLYYSNDKDYGGCTVCGRIIRSKTLAYKCYSQECSFKLDKPCAQLQSKLEHPSHLLHPLTLCFIPLTEAIVCRCCDEWISGLFAFSCGECNFYLHCDCAQVPTLKHPFHEHDLFYFDRRITPSISEEVKPHKFKCRACLKSCSLDLFRCVECDFTLHYDCSQSPLTVKSEHHIDPLVLRESYIEDDSGEYYCDICERRRDPKKWVYFCKTCELVAHVECALSPVKLEVIEEVDFIIRKEDIQKREEEIKLAQEQVDAKEVSLRPLMKELESMRAELESQRAELEGLKTEHAKWINMGVIEEIDATNGEPQTLRAKLKELET